MKLMPVINLKAGRGSNLANENSAQGRGLGQGFLDASRGSHQIVLFGGVLVSMSPRLYHCSKVTL